VTKYALFASIMQHTGYRK